MPLVINSLGGGHTHTHTHRHTHTHTRTQTYSHRGQKQFQETSRVLAFGWCVPGLKIKDNSDEIHLTFFSQIDFFTD